MDATRYRQIRGLLIAWRERPKWLREPPQIQEYRYGGTQSILPGVKVRERVIRANNYRRVMLPAFGPLTGVGSISQHRGRCRWCKLPIKDAPRRLWHEDCLPAYWAATGQQGLINEHLTRRFREENANRQPHCDQCGSAMWIQMNHIEDRFPDHTVYLMHRQRGMEWTVPPRQLRGEAASIELDYRDALSVAWASGNERRLIRALTLDNFQYLCRSCHVAKTADDRRRMNNLIAGRPEDWNTSAQGPRPESRPATETALQHRLV